MEKRCVITGLGLICAAGNDVDTCWQNICAGKTGIDEVKSVSTEGCVSHVGAEVHCEDLPAPEYDRSVRLCLHAAHEAVRDGRLTDSAVREAGVILGSCVGGAASIDHYYTGLLQGRTEEQDVLKMSASAIAANTAFALGANGETANIVNACAAGTMSVSYACDLIRLGRGEIFLAGGTDAFSSLAYAGFNALHALSAGPCSPLNHSNGISLGEGAGVLVVEEYEHAIRRGAKIYCEVAGWGVSSDAFHITAPQPQGEGQMAALHRAMVNAGTEAGDIGYINAHGTGTAKNDAAEFLSLHTLFEGAAPSVSSTKSMTGHCLGAAGAIEAVLSVKALTENTVLPTTGYAPEDLAPLAEKAGNLDCVVNAARERELENVMSNSFAFGGTNASIIFSKKPHPAEQTGKRRICVTGIGELLSEADGTASVQRELTPEDFGARDVKLGFYRKLDRFSQMQVLSGVDALRDAGFTIDADNASRTAMKDVMAEVAVYGTPTIKRIYGDWTSPNMSTWKSILLETAITPIQQYSYTTGKNATDSAMIIDAMDILYSGNCDGFVLVSSDSDFTRLATRLREAGMKVYGMGEKKTPKPFIVACDKFVYIEVIRAAAQQAAQQEKESVPQKSSKKSSKKAAQQAVSAPAASAVPQDMVELIADSLENLCDEDGYTLMGKLSNLLMKKQPDFDPRNYGFSKLSKMIKSLDRFEVDVRQVGDNNTDIYVRDKQGKDK